MERVASGHPVISFRISLAPTSPAWTGPGSPASARYLTAVSGNNQRGQPGEQLPDPLVVRVTDGSGAPLPGIDVLWQVVDGDGEVPGTPIQIDGEPGEATVIATDENGRCAARLVLGTTPGLLTVRASAFFAAAPVYFQATGE